LAAAPWVNSGILRAAARLTQGLPATPFPDGERSCAIVAT
jgi:hypothetical protein